MKNFYSKVIKDTSGCWLWSGCIAKDGYGNFSLNRKVEKAHRASWIIHKGSIPNGKYVCHSCDVRHCVNPDHLWLGTHKDNMHDMVSKNRQSKDGFDKSTKLSFEKACLIRELYTKGLYNHKELAEIYKVARSTIHSIVLNKSWIK